MLLSGAFGAPDFRRALKIQADARLVLGGEKACLFEH
jgi:hypothetical protein